MWRILCFIRPHEKLKQPPKKVPHGNGDCATWLLKRKYTCMQFLFFMCLTYALPRSWLCALPTYCTLMQEQTSNHISTFTVGANWPIMCHNSCTWYLIWHFTASYFRNKIEVVVVLLQVVGSIPAKNPITQILMNLNFIDPQTRVLNYFWK